MTAKFFLSPITQMIANEHGIAVRMEAGVPQELHPDLHGEALARGVAPADGEIPPVVLPTEVTLEAVIEAIDQLLEAGDAKAFGANGEPKLPALRAIAGKGVTDELRDAAWEVVKARPQE